MTTRVIFTGYIQGEPDISQTKEIESGSENFRLTDHERVIDNILSDWLTENNCDCGEWEYASECGVIENQDSDLEYDTNIQLAAIFEAIDELFAPFTNGKIHPEATVLRNKIEQKLMDVTRNSEPLPIGEYKPSEMVVIVDRVPVVNEDLVIE